MHRAQNGGTFKIAPPDFSLINLKEFCNFKVFSKSSNPHIFLLFGDINFIFCTGTQDNDLIQWCDFRKNRTGVRPVLGCGSLRPPPRNLSRLNTPGLIGLRPCFGSSLQYFQVSPLDIQLKSSLIPFF